MSTDGLFNIIAFIVGLGIGLFQLYYAQHQFEVQQREKMDELRKILTEIQQRLAIMEEVTSQRSFDVQDRLIGLVAGDEAVAEFTEETITKVQAVVANELEKAGVEDSIQRTKEIEKKLSDVLEKSASSLVDATNMPATTRLSSRQIQVLELLSKGHGSLRISQELFISRNTARSHIINIYRIFGVNNQSELLAKHGDLIQSIINANQDLD